MAYTLPYDATAASLDFSTYLETTKDITFTFDFACYGPNAIGSEGFCVLFSNTIVETDRLGGPGPGLGYAAISGVNYFGRSSFPGAGNGVMGIGFDITGNYGSNAFFKSGETVPQPNTISVRGSQGNDFKFIARSTELGSTLFKRPASLYQQIRFNEPVEYKRARVRLTDFGKRLVVDIKKITDYDFVNYLDIDISESIFVPATIRCALTFTSGIITDTIFKVKNININGVFTDVASPTDDVYRYDTDTASLSGYFTYNYPSGIFEYNEIMDIRTVDRYDQPLAGPTLISANSGTQQEGAPYSSDSDLLRITSI